MKLGYIRYSRFARRAPITWIGCLHARGVLELLDAAGRERVLKGATRLTYPARTVTHTRARDRQVAIVIESGLARIFVTSDDGRQASVRYLHAGDTYAAVEALGLMAQADLQAITDTTVHLIDPTHLAREATTDRDIGAAAMRAMGHEINHLVRLITVRSLGSMTERLAFDLLERCSNAQLLTGKLVCRATQQELADSIGSTREVVTRIIGDLRRSKIVSTSPGRIHVLDPARLSFLVRGLVET